MGASTWALPICPEAALAMPRRWAFQTACANWALPLAASKQAQPHAFSSRPSTTPSLRNSPATRRPPASAFAAPAHSLIRYRAMLRGQTNAHTRSSAAVLTVRPCLRALSRARAPATAPPLKTRWPVFRTASATRFFWNQRDLTVPKCTPTAFPPACPLMCS